MKYSRCSCGKCEYWDSGMPPQPCQGCDECGTTYSGHPEGHKPLIDHDWEPRYNEKTGEQDRRICKRCFRSEKLPK